MFKELEDYLKSITTEENVAICRNAFDTLERANYLSFQTDLETILSSADNFPSEQNLFDIFGVFEQSINSAVGEVGVRFSPDANLGLMTETLNAILILPNYGDPKPIIQFAETDNDYRDKFCDILSVVSPYNAEDFLIHIDYVPEWLVGRIAQQASENIDLESPQPDLGWIRQRFVQFREKYPDTIAQEAIEEGISLGLDLGMLLDRHSKELDGLGKKPKDLALQAMSLVLISNTPNEEVFETVKDLLDDYAENVNVTTQAHDTLLNLRKVIGQNEET